MASCVLMHISWDLHGKIKLKLQIFTFRICFTAWIRGVNNDAENRVARKVKSLSFIIWVFVTTFTLSCYHFVNISSKWRNTPPILNIVLTGKKIKFFTLIDCQINESSWCKSTHNIVLYLILISRPKNFSMQLGCLDNTITINSHNH